MPSSATGRVWLAVSVCLASLGCAPESLPSPQVSVRDSAGIALYEIAELPTIDEPSWEWSIEVERTVFTGESAPGERPLLYNPQAFLRLANGALVVVDAGEPRLAIISPDSSDVLARFARSGQGPGEILSSNSLLTRADDDSFWVTDPGNQRRTRFSLSGELLDEHPATLPGSGGMAIQRPGSGDVFFWRVFRSTESGPADLEDRVLRYDPGENSVVPVAPMPPRHESRSMNTSSFPYFAPRGGFAPIESGGVVVARSDSSTFAHYLDDGRLVGILRAPLRPRRLDVADIPAVIEEMAVEFPPAANATRSDFHDSFSVWSQLWPAGDSLFALEHTRWTTPAGEPAVELGQRVWRLFTVNGRYAGVIRFPVGFGFPYLVEQGRITGVQRDTFGIATIVALRVTPPG